MQLYLTGRYSISLAMYLCYTAPDRDVNDIESMAGQGDSFPLPSDIASNITVFLNMRHHNLQIPIAGRS